MPATGTPDQCMRLLGYDIPPLQAPSIYISGKDVVTCRNRYITFDGDLLLLVGVYSSLVADSKHICPVNMP